MRFTLEIELGNEAMQKDYHIRQALQVVAYKARMSEFPEAGDEGIICDENGATVGKWEVSETPAATVPAPDDVRSFWRHEQPAAPICNQCEKPATGLVGVQARCDEHRPAPTSPADWEQYERDTLALKVSATEEPIRPEDEAEILITHRKHDG